MALGETSCGTPRRAGRAARRRRPQAVLPPPSPRPSNRRERRLSGRHRPGQAMVCGAVETLLQRRQRRAVAEHCAQLLAERLVASEHPLGVGEHRAEDVDRARVISSPGVRIAGGALNPIGAGDDLDVEVASDGAFDAVDKIGQAMAVRPSRRSMSSRRTRSRFGIGSTHRRHLRGALTADEQGHHGAAPVRGRRLRASVRA